MICSLDSISVFRSQMETNFLGTLNVTTGILPHMRARRAGTIVMLGSRSSWTGEVVVSIST
jgi:NADP-dependent 3-hydroxy acid dehydrogenase YdfG